ARCDQFARADHAAAAELAIEADTHQPMRPQDIDEHPPAGQRIGQMVQHPHAVDDVELPAKTAQLEDVSLTVADVADAELARLALRIGEAGQAEVDREQLRAGELRGD